MKNKLLYIFICFGCLIGCTNETKVQSIKLNPTELTLNIGESSQIEMIIEPISATIYTPVSWQSSNSNVAQVDNKGNITAIYAGECLITCKTKHHEAYCKINVIAPQYEFNFTNAILFDEGIKPESNQRNLILRLYDSNLQIDSTGIMFGNGVFMNINLYAPANSEELPAMTYQTSDTENDYTIKQGALVQEGNSYYATGSYLGQYTDNGLSALFFSEGKVEVNQNTKYNIICSFIGAQKETINATFNGSINCYDTSKENEIITIEYDNAITEPIDIPEEPNLNHTKITLSHKDTTLIFIARIPKSINTIIDGNYYLSDNIIAYTLINDKCSFITPNATLNILSAILKINNNQYTGTFTDENGKKYSFFSSKNKNNTKQPIKSFVH